MAQQLINIDGSNLYPVTTFENVVNGENNLITELADIRSSIRESDYEVIHTVDIWCKPGPDYTILRLYNDGIVEDYVNREYAEHSIKLVVNENSDSTRYIVLPTPRGVTPAQYFVSNGGVNRVIRDYNLGGAANMKEDKKYQDIWIRMEGAREYTLVGYLTYPHGTE